MALGGNACCDLGMQSRINLLKKIRHVDLSGAVDFKLVLCKIAANETSDISDQVNVASIDRENAKSISCATSHCD